MTAREFSDEFSVLLNSFGITPNIILDEYEKSIFLTQAQEQLVIAAYTGKDPGFNLSFEETEELRNYLGTLVKTVIYRDSDIVENAYSLYPNAVTFKRDPDMWFIVYESAKLVDNRLGCLSGNTVSVVPATHDELHRTVDNPFRGANKNRVLRLDKGSIALNESSFELISKYKIEEYTVRFITKPTPIILVKLSDGLSIDDTSEITKCILPETLHRVILNRAVQLAIVAKTQLNK